MRLKTTKDASDACKDALLRGGFEVRVTNARGVWIRLSGDKPDEVYEVWFPSDGFLGDYFVAIYKRTVAASKTISGVDWDFSNKIILRLE